MKYCILIIATLVLLSVSFAASQNKEDVLPATYLEKVESIPDLDQTDPALGLIEGGMLSCGSVSATNSFAWLADNGFDKMMLRNDDGSVSYAKTAQAMDRIFRLKKGRGVLPPAFMSGVERYLSEQGYTENEYSLEFQGWLHPEGFEGTIIPDMDAVKRGLVGDGAVWLAVGFYYLNEQRDAYQVISHHYVTLVGYGVDENGEEDPNVLIVHDPAPRSGPGIAHNHVHIEELQAGRITVDPSSQAVFAYWQLPVDATGYYKLGDGLAYNDLADLAILDGVIILKLE